MNDTVNARCSRRSFLKGTAALAVAAGAADLVEVSPAFAEEAAEEKVYPGACRGFCSGGCSLNLHVKDGKLVRTSARELDDAVYTRICQKGYTHPYRVYSPERITAPLRRVGEKGSGEWEQISWEEAVAEIAEKWKTIIEESGHSAMGAISLTGNFGAVSGGAAGAWSRFRQLTGMSTIANDVDGASVYACMHMMGSSFFNTANEPKDLANAKTILIWGANPAVSQVQTMKFITEAGLKGANIVTIDPVYNANAAVSDWYLPIKSATDGALAMGMMNVVVQNGWQDIAFLTEHTDAPFLVKPDTKTLLRLSDLGLAEPGSEQDSPVVMDSDGNLDVPANISSPLIEGSVEVNGQTVTTVYSQLLERIAEWPVERASEACGISVEDIVKLTDMYANQGPSTIYTFFGADHYYNGHWNYSCMAALALLTGNVGKHGASMGVAHTPGSAGLNDAYAVANVPCPVEMPKYLHVFRLGEMVFDKTYNGEPCEMRGLYIAYANPVANAADRNDTIETFKALDLVVVNDMVMSETAEYADYVLPCCHWFENEDVMGHMLTHSCAVYQAPALAPMGDSKPDFEIFGMLAEALGYSGYFEETQTEWLKAILDNEAAQGMGMTYEKLVEVGSAKMIPTGEEAYVFAEGGNFPTATGRASLFFENPWPTNDYAPEFDFEKEYLPYWEEALEVGEHSPVREMYPYQLMTEHSRFRTHTQWHEVEALMEVDTEQWIYIGVEDAEELGIEDGDLIRVYNDRGSLTGNAKVRPNNPKGILSAVKGWTNKQVVDGHLSNHGTKQSNPFCANQPFNDCAVTVEKA